MDHRGPLCTGFRDRDMTDWTSRIANEEAGQMLRAAIAKGLLDGAGAVLFHDLGRMRRRIARLQAAFPPTALHAIAIKANPLVEVLRAVVDTGVGLEAASYEEVQLALAAGCLPERIVFDSPAKTSTELQAALQLGIGVNADNFAELARIDAMLEAGGTDSTVGLRINPQVGAGSIATTSVAAKDSKFGVPICRRTEIVAAFQRYPWLSGLHAHVGSQGCDPQQLIDAAAGLVDLQMAIFASVGDRRVSTIDIGGGLPVAYRAGDQPLNIAAFVEQLRCGAPDLFRDDVRVVTDFGRCVQAGCGVAFSQVEYVKDASSTAVVHLGADLFLRRVYQPTDWYHEMFVLDREGWPKATAPVSTNVVGPLCFGGDILGRDVPLPRVEPGDWIGFRDVGAYTLSMWSRHCSRGMPLVLGYEADTCPRLTVLREAETADDIVRFWSAARRGHH